MLLLCNTYYNTYSLYLLLCVGDRFPSSDFNQSVNGEGCNYMLSLKQCLNDPKDDHDITQFDYIEVDRIVSTTNNVYKYTSEDKSGTKKRFDIIGIGGDKTTWSQCFDGFVFMVVSVLTWQIVGFCFQISLI